MTDIREEISEKLLDLITRRGPVGWYVIEHSFTLHRGKFPCGTNVMTFLNELEAKGEIKKDENGRYVPSEPE